ncbi:hypothetical protein H8356DRAFT_1368897 [Neocallimastix lanati (nom. inval.)]|nr:hypothetical protein H8356DRAFT_1368897 [Neocallimastix sp. JGI-2020a]
MRGYRVIKLWCMAKKEPIFAGSIFVLIENANFTNEELIVSKTKLTVFNERTPFFKNSFKYFQFPEKLSFKDVRYRFKDDRFKVSQMLRIIQENNPREYSKRIIQENNPREYSKRIIQENNPREYSKRIIQENNPREYSKKIIQENNPREYSKRIIQENNPREYSKRIIQENNQRE